MLKIFILACLIAIRQINATEPCATNALTDAVSFNVNAGDKEVNLNGKTRYINNNGKCRINHDCYAFKYSNGTEVASEKEIGCMWVKTDRRKVQFDQTTPSCLNPRTEIFQIRYCTTENSDCTMCRYTPQITINIIGSCSNTVTISGSTDAVQHK